MKMNKYKIRRAELTTTLRSGKYEQGTKVLRQGNTFCCLGVAEDLRGVVWDYREPTYFLDGTSNSKVLSREGMEYYGFQTPSGDFLDSSLAELNDSGLTFSQIADIIDYEPRGLFFT